MTATTLWTWGLIGLLGLAALAPALLVLRRADPRARGRREADLALYRAHLAELDRERGAGRLDEAAHRAATLEVQRRLLAAPEEAGRGAPRRASSRGLVLAAVALMPALALLLYGLQGRPGMPSATYAERQEALKEWQAAQDRDETLLADLRARLAQLDPHSEAAQRGYVLLGNAERGRGRPAQAAEAFRAALRAGFDAGIAAQLAQLLLETDRVEEARALLAEALPRAPGNIGLRFLGGQVEAQAGRPEQARAVWQALIADAPPDAPWRGMVERRMAELP